jgi:2,3-bisphosphoglycerate-independent phosphoglycerate mutase
MTPSVLYGRGSLEAASLGVRLDPKDIAFRCNLVTLRFEGSKILMEDFSAGHISDEEAKKIIIDLTEKWEPRKFVSILESVIGT